MCARVLGLCVYVLTAAAARPVTYIWQMHMFPPRVVRSYDYDYDYGCIRQGRT